VQEYGGTVCAAKSSFLFGFSLGSTGRDFIAENRWICPADIAHLRGFMERFEKRRKISSVS
jgi:hypothetical protein